MTFLESAKRIIDALCEPSEPDIHDADESEEDNDDDGFILLTEKYMSLKRVVERLDTDMTKWNLGTEAKIDAALDKIGAIQRRQKAGVESEDISDVKRRVAELVSQVQFLLDNQGHMTNRLDALTAIAKELNARLPSPTKNTP